LNLAACQTGPVPRNASRTETVERLIHLLEKASMSGAELAVFPEMALTTFFPRWALDDPHEIEAFYERHMPGPHTQRLYDAARRLKIGFALGFAELHEDQGRVRRFNSMDLVGADGTSIGRYRKMHIPGSEQAQPGVTTHLERRYFEPGNLGFPVYAYRGVRIGLALCNDRRWPETYRMLCLNGAQVVLIGYNTPTTLEEAPGASANVSQSFAHASGGLSKHRMGGCRRQGRIGRRSGADRRFLHHCPHRGDRGAGSVGRR
jgi:predicted amidohydrolase